MNKVCSGPCARTLPEFFFASRRGHGEQVKDWCRECWNARETARKKQRVLSKDERRAQLRQQMARSERRGGEGVMGHILSFVARERVGVETRGAVE